MLHAIERVMPSFRTLGKKKQPCTPTAHLENANTDQGNTIEAKNEAIRDCESKLQTIMSGDFFTLDDIYQAERLTIHTIEFLKQLIESTQEDQQSHLETRDLFCKIYAKLLILEAGTHTCYGFASWAAVDQTP